jgi:hypothetical protein
MSRFARVLSVTLVCAALAGLAPSGALGAPTGTVVSTNTADAPPAPLAVGTMDAQIWPGQEGPQTVVIVGVVLDQQVKLPARIQVPVPVGSKVQWAGEILGGDAGADKERKYELKTGAGGARYAEFTLSLSHRGQIDTGGIPMTAKGNDVTTQVEFVQSARATSTGFSVRIPAGVSEVKIVPTPVGTPDVNAAGESLYTLPPKTLPLGASTLVTVAYNVSPTGTSQGSGPSMTTVYLVLGVLLVAALVFTGLLATRQARSARERAEVAETADSTEDAEDDETLHE